MPRPSVLLLCLVALACNREQPEPKPTTTAQPKATTPAPAAKPAPPSGETHALLEAAGLELVPKKALLVVGARTVDAVLKGIDYAHLDTVVGPTWARLVSDIVAETGRNLLDPKAWTEMGLDLSKPMLLAALGDPEEATMTVATVGPGFEAAWIAMLKKRDVSWKRETLGDVVILRPEVGHGTALVFRGGRVALVEDDADGVWAKTVATLQPADSMAGHAPFAADLRGLAAGRDIGGWLNTTALVDAIVADLGRDHAQEWDERRLKDAQARGDAQQIERIEANIRRRKLEDPLRGAKARAKGVLVRGILKGIGGLAFGLTFDGPVLRFDARLPLSAESLPRAVFARGKGPLRLVEAYDRTPTVMGTGRIDVDQAVQRAKALAAVGGGDDPISELLEAAQQLLQADPAELPKLLDGELGIALHLAPTENTRGMFGFLNGLTGAGLFGMKDAKAATARWKLIAGQAGSVGPDGLVRESFGRDKTIVVGPAGNHLAGATDAAVHTRIGSGDAGSSFKKGIQSARLKALLERPDPAQLWMLDPGQFAIAVVRSDAREAAKRFRKALGQTALRVDVDDVGLRITGGQFTGSESVAAAIAAATRFALHEQ